MSASSGSPQGAEVTGTVRWWKDDKGYGRINGDDGYVYFAHFSGIVGEGFRELECGQRVRFQWLGMVGDHGRHAAQNIRVIEDDAGSSLRDEVRRIASDPADALEREAAMKDMEGASPDWPE